VKNWPMVLLSFLHRLGLLEICDGDSTWYSSRKTTYPVHIRLNLLTFLCEIKYIY